MHESSETDNRRSQFRVFVMVVRHHEGWVPGHWRARSTVLVDVTRSMRRLALETRIVVFRSVDIFNTCLIVSILTRGVAPKYRRAVHA